MQQPATTSSLQRCILIMCYIMPSSSTYYATWQNNTQTADFLNMKWNQTLVTAFQDSKIMETKALRILRCLDFINYLLFQWGYISGTGTASVPSNEVGEMPVQPVSQKYCSYSQPLNQSLPQITYLVYDPALTLHCWPQCNVHTFTSPHSAGLTQCTLKNAF
jgi:hypothetical protein